jgi:hypothetical protein
LAAHLPEIARGCQNCKSEKCPDILLIDGEEIKGCALKNVTKESLMFIRAYNYFKQGFFPNEGSWLNQPAKLLNAFSVIEKALTSIEEEKERKRKLFRR